MKIAITGANGFVGSFLLGQFLREGHQPVALVRRDFSFDKVITRIVDYNSTTDIQKAIEDCDVLIHNAGKTKTKDYLEMVEANVGITRRVIEALNACNRDIRLIYISSQAVSGPSPQEYPKKEDEAPNPLSNYGKSKAIAENLIRKTCQKPWVILRPCPVYGPGDQDFLSLFKLCKTGFSFQIGREKRPLNMIYVGQLAEMILKVLQKEEIDREVIFATDTRVYTQDEIAALICRAFGHEAKKVLIPMSMAWLVFYLADRIGKLIKKPMAINLEKYKEISAIGFVADNSKALKLLNWNPRYNMPEYIRETIKWYQEKDWL